MKQFKTLVALVLALALTMTLVGTAMAANGTITIKPPTGIDPTASNSYPIYKVFDAIYSDSGISYSVMSGKNGVPDVAAQMDSGYNEATTPHFIVDDAGNVHYGTKSGNTITDVTSGDLSEAAIKAIAAYVAGDDPVATATSTGTADATASIPQDGYYYITTTTGTAVTITSFRPHAEVNDKNSPPTPHKIISSIEDNAGDIDADGKEALAQVGKKVYYSVDFQIKPGAKGYEFHDYMETGLSYNNDVAVKLGTTVAGATAVDTAANTWQAVTADTNETIKVNFADAWVKANEGKYIVVTYSATVTSDALQTDPLTNTVYIKYGENHGYKSTEDHTDVYNAKVIIKKVDGSNAPLEGAGFILKNNADDTYYVQGTNSISWTSSIDSATVVTSTRATDGQGNKTGDAVANFAGLPNGSYTLIEKVVPSGYNKAPDQTITINGVDATPRTLTVEATVTNNAGNELPGTGGIGTTIFYIAGIVLVLGAAAIIIARRKAEQE